MGWSEFVLALCAFFLSHALLVRAPVKPWLVARIGAQGFSALYSVLSLAVLAWVMIAAARAPYVRLWAWAPWQNWLAIVGMLAACLIVALSLGRPNPFSFGGPDTGFDPDAPGLVGVMRHPLLVAAGLWASVHGVANGNLAHGALFFSFAGFSLLGMRIIDRRRQRLMGADWAELWTRVRSAKAAPISIPRDVPRILIGALGWCALILGHGAVIGVSPWP